ECCWHLPGRWVSSAPLSWSPGTFPARPPLFPLRFSSPCNSATTPPRSDCSAYRFCWHSRRCGAVSGSSAQSGDDMSLLLRNVSLSLTPFELEVDAELRGPVTVIFGPSGSGKTSLLDIVAGLRHARSAF